MCQIITNLESDQGRGKKTRSAALRSVSVTALSIAAMLAIGTGTAGANGGTAKPPPAPGTPLFPMNPPVAPQIAPSTSAALGFDIVGFIQQATTTSNCGAAAGSN